MDGNADTSPEAQFAPPQFHSGDHFPPPASVVLHDEPAPRRTGLFVVVGLLLTAVVAGGAFMLTKDDEEEAAAYSLDAAVEALDESESIAYTVDVDSMGQEVSIDAEFDADTGNTRVTMRMDGIFDNGIEMIVSTDPQIIYVSSTLFSVIGVDIDTEWIKMDEEFLAEQGENAFESAVSNDVLNAGDLIASATSVEDIGLETIDGEQLQHYRVTVDKETALANSPQMQDQITEAGGEMPDEVAYEMWVTEDNRLRRMGVDLDIGTSIISTVFTVKAPGAPISVEAPVDADVTDAEELL